jgi:hypothetical protein
LQPESAVGGEAEVAGRSAGFGGAVDVQAILDFVDSGHNVLLGLNSDASETMRNLAAEFGLDVDDRGTKVFDHLHYATLTDGSAPDHTLIAAADLVDSPVMTGGPYKVGAETRKATRALQAASQQLITPPPGPH